MKTNQKEINIKNLIKDYSIETTPKVYEKIGSLKDNLFHNNDVYITYLPNEDPLKVIKTSKKINEEGLQAIPHLPARSIKDFTALEKYIGNLSEDAGCKKILVIGGGANQIGKINLLLKILNNKI